MTSSCTSSSSSNFFPARCSFRWRNKWKSLSARSVLYGGWSTISHVHLGVEKSYDETHLAFGGTLDRHCHFKRVSLKQNRFYRCSNEHGLQVKDQGRQQCCHNKNKNFPYRPTSDVSLLSGHASYFRNETEMSHLKIINDKFQDTKRKLLAAMYNR